MLLHSWNMFSVFIAKSDTASLLNSLVCLDSMFDTFWYLKLEKLDKTKTIQFETKRKSDKQFFLTKKRFEYVSEIN